MEFGGLSLSLKFEFQKTLPSLLTIEGSYVPAAEQRISAVGLTIYMLLVALIKLYIIFFPSNYISFKNIFN